MELHEEEAKLHTNLTKVKEILGRIKNDPKMIVGPYGENTVEIINLTLSDDKFVMAFANLAVNVVLMHPGMMHMVMRESIHNMLRDAIVIDMNPDPTDPSIHTPIKDRN